jgi:hypothetical protein
MAAGEHRCGRAVIDLLEAGLPVHVGDVESAAVAAAAGAEAMAVLGSTALTRLAESVERMSRPCCHRGRTIAYGIAFARTEVLDAHGVHREHVGCMAVACKARVRACEHAGCMLLLAALSLLYVFSGAHRCMSRVDEHESKRDGAGRCELNAKANTRERTRVPLKRRARCSRRGQGCWQCTSSQPSINKVIESLSH